MSYPEYCSDPNHLLDRSLLKIHLLIEKYLCSHLLQDAGKAALQLCPGRASAEGTPSRRRVQQASRPRRGSGSLRSLESGGFTLVREEPSLVNSCLHRPLLLGLALLRWGVVCGAQQGPALSHHSTCALPESDPTCRDDEVPQNTRDRWCKACVSPLCPGERKQSREFTRWLLGSEVSPLTAELRQGL